MFYWTLSFDQNTTNSAKEQFGSLQCGVLLLTEGNRGSNTPDVRCGSAFPNREEGLCSQASEAH